MITQFTQAELDRLTIRPVERQKRSSDYLAEREQVWQEQMVKVLARNGHMWNGEVYTFEDLVVPATDQVILCMSNCEYKDLVFSFIKGQAYVAGRYGEDHVPQFTGVSCVPLTQDGRFVFGIRADRPEQGEPIGGIGGTLNKDEMEVHSFKEIRQSMLREIHEETVLPCTAEDLHFYGLLASSYSYHFLFTFRLPIHSEDVNCYHRPGEFSRLVAITEAEAWEMNLPMTGGFRLWRPHLKFLLGLLKTADKPIFR